MKGMTGFGYSEFQDQSVQINLEIRSYNNRHLDLFVVMPPFLSVYEQNIRSYLSKRIERGRVEVLVRIKELKEDISLVLDEFTAKAYMAVLKDLAALMGTEVEVRLADLLSMEGIVKTEKTRDLDRFWEILAGLLERAFAEFDEHRRGEGESTKKDILGCLKEFEAGLNAIEERAKDLEENIITTLRRRFQQLMGNGIDENRIYAETAVMLVKYNINEEIVRTKIHLESFKKLMEQQGAVGKKLDFLCQELNREVNTIGSKSTLAEVNSRVVDLKDSLEMIREQLRNVE